MRAVSTLSLRSIIMLISWFECKKKYLNFLNIYFELLHNHCEICVYILGHSAIGNGANNIYTIIKCD